MIQWRGFHAGLNLVSNGSHPGKKYIICYRGRCFNNKNSTTGGIRLNPCEMIDNYASFAKGESERIVRIKKNTRRKRKATDIGHRYKTKTKKPINKEKLYRMRITIFIDEDKDLFYIKSGIGNKCHKFHPRFHLDEIVPMSSAVNKNVDNLKKDLSIRVTP